MASWPKVNSKELETHIHLTVQVKGGKIVEEHGFWDSSTLILALQEIEAAAKAEEMMERANDFVKHQTKKPHIFRGFF